MDANEKVATAAAERDAAARAAEEARADADARIAAAGLEAGERIEQEVAAVRAEMQQRLDALAQELEQAERNRERAERRAEGNSLSRYLLARLRGEAAEGVAAAPDEDGASATDATEAEVAADPETSAKDDDK